MTDLLKKAIEYRLDLNLWPPTFIEGCALVAAKHRLHIDSVIMAFITGTSIFVGKSEIRVGGSDRVEVGSLWVLNIQVSAQMSYSYSDSNSDTDAYSDSDSDANKFILF